MPTSDKQIAANRCNALRSTGPTSPEGKAAMHLNALKHGILAREAVIKRAGFNESQDELEDLLTHLHEELAPQSRLETLLVQQIAICYWRLRRVLHADSHEFGHSLEQSLLESQPVDDPTERPLLTHVPALPPTERVDLIVRYEKALLNQLDRALRQLATLQRGRESESESSILGDQIPDAR